MHMESRKQIAWRAKSQRNTETIPFIPWLQDRGSLTTQLQARGKFAVRLLRQGIGTPARDEAAALGIKPKRVAWVREVALHCDGKPLVFAHTILPYRPRGPMTGWLARLGNRSLGALLFSHTGFKRGQLECKRLDHRHTLFQPAINAMQPLATPPVTLWARRSRFLFGTQAVLVTEVFSPALRFDSRPEKVPEKINRC